MSLSSARLRIEKEVTPLISEMVRCEKTDAARRLAPLEMNRAITKIGLIIQDTISGADTLIISPDIYAISPPFYFAPAVVIYESIQNAHVDLGEITDFFQPIKIMEWQLKHQDLITHPQISAIIGTYSAARHVSIER